MNYIYFMLLFFWSELGGLAFAADPDSEVEFENIEEVEVKSNHGIESIIDNAAFSNGIQSGTDSLNRSIDSIMEGLFYNLMDQELSYQITDPSTFKLKITRDLNDTSDGMYVVVDKVGLGPEFNTPLTTAYGLPIFLSGAGSVNVFNIYLRSDGNRLAEKSELPWWRSTLNNWFGLVPLLTAILPPSFNPNEMYDPVKQWSTPFIFPRSADMALNMPVGNLRSYSVTGAIHLGIDLLSRQKDALESKLGEPFEVGLPIQIFREGEHRINVFRRTENTFWVGLSRQDRRGGEIGGKVGRLFYIFNRVASFYPGLPAVIIPLDVSYSKAEITKYDLIFEYDLRNRESKLAFDQALTGDFSESERIVSLSNESQTNQGINFQLARNSVGDQKSSGGGINLFILKDKKQLQNTMSEVGVKDAYGYFELLETSHRIESSFWDVLVGKEVLKFENRATIRVKKVNNRFEFDKSAGDPLEASLVLNINDKFLDSLELKAYLRIVRLFTSIGLNEFEDIPLRDTHSRKAFLASLAVGNPLKNANIIGATPTHLGKFGVEAEIRFRSDAIEILKKKNESEFMSAMAKALELDEKKLYSVLDSLKKYPDPIGFLGWASFPLELFGFNVEEIDIYSEISRFLDAITKLRASVTPEQEIAAIKSLFETKYPAQLASVLSELCGSAVTREVTFQVKPVKSLSKETFDKLEMFNRKVFSSAEKTDGLSRHGKVLDMLSSLNPTGMRELRARPILGKAKLILSKNIVNDNSYLILTIEAPDAEKDKARFFIRIEQAGSLNVGRFVLYEDLVSSEALVARGNDKLPGTLAIKIGDSEDSDPQDFILDQAIESGGDFVAIVSFSYDGELWSKENEVKFKIVNGKIFRRTDI